MWIEGQFELVAMGVLTTLVLAATVPQLRTALAGVRWNRATPLLCAGLPVLVAALLPPGEYHFAGHEGSYGELLDGGLPLADLGSYRIMPIPTGLAALLGAVLPPELARGLWIVGNRAALAVVLLFAAASSAHLAKRLGQPEDRAGLFCVLGLACVAPLLGWSATAWAIVPALALGTVALFAALAGRPAAAITWGALAVGSRLETAALAGAAGLIVLPVLRPASRREALHLAVAGLVAAGVVLSLLSRGESLPAETSAPEWSLVLENLGAVRLAGAWGTPWALLVLAALFLRSPRPRRVALPLVLGLVACLALLVPLFDVGARHLLPWSVLASVLVGAWASDRTGIAALALLPLMAWGGGDVVGLSHRYAAGEDAHLPAWVEAADRGGAGALADRVDADCYLVLPGGEESHPGASPTWDVNEVHNAALEIADGVCVQWAVHTEAEFLGDCTAERFDRARLVLGLTPAGWIDRPDGVRWMLWERR